MTVTYHSGERIQGTQADFDGTPAVSGGWKELGRTTLGSAGDTINVTGLADKRYLMILKSFGGSTGGNDRLNGDSGSNYSSRYGVSGSSDYTNTNKTAYPWNNAGYSTTPNFVIDYVSNLSSKEKLIHRDWIYQYTAGASNPPRRAETIAKWANTSDSINATSMYSQTTDWDSGSEVVVLGYDPDDTHTTNFWEPLADVTLSSAGDNLSSGTITAKKYLWVQAAIMTSSAGTNVQHQITFNNDTGNNYAQRYSYQGGADATLTSRANWLFSAGSNNKGIAFLNFFIINNSANEKLCMGNTVLGDTAGAGTSPKREEAVAKWANTSSQITEIDIDNTLGSIDYKAGSFIKVWGSN